MVALRTIPKRLVKVLEDLEIRGQLGDDCSIAFFRSEKSPGDLRTLTANQTLGKDHQQTLV